MSKVKKNWSQLSPVARAAVVAVAVLDVGMKGWALADLVNRPQDQVKGSKTAWAIALALVNSAGVLPAAYLGLARKPA